MTKSDSIFVAPLPKSLVKFGTPIAALLLTSMFIIAGFPYHHLTNRVTAIASRALSVEIDAAQSGLTFGLDGLGFRFEDIRVETPTGDYYDLDAARLGAGWSTSWFTATPTVFFEIRSFYGDAHGTYRMGDDASWSGAMTDVTLDDLGFLEQLLPIQITGTLNARGDVATSDGELQGPLTFAFKQGILEHPSFPMEIPFETLRGQLVFGEGQYLTIETFELSGPVLNFTVNGTLGKAESIVDGPLDLDVEFKDVAPETRNMLRMLGASVGPDGNSKLHIGGSFDNPVMQ
jgi:type II secretion system protein N